MMKKRSDLDLNLGDRMQDPGLAERFGRAGHSRDIATQLSSLRRRTGLSQKELAKRVGTSQQQISRLESASYKGHSLSMLRRVAEVLGAVVHVEIQQKNDPTRRIIAEGGLFHRDKKRTLQNFEINLLREEKADIVKNFRIVEGLYHEATAMGTFLSRNSLDGIEVDLKVAKVVNSVSEIT